MSIELILATLSLNISCGNLSANERLSFKSVYAYGVDCLEQVTHMNCSEEEKDILLRRLRKRLSRALEDLVDGDYGHC